jgi:hypothetical protein
MDFRALRLALLQLKEKEKIMSNCLVHLWVGGTYYIPHLHGPIF